MKKIKKTLIIMFYVTCLALLVIFKDTINTYIIENYIYVKNTTEYTVNEYAKKESYNFVSTTSTFKAYNKQNLFNIIYTVVDSGNDTFTFYCDDKYITCQKDIQSISNETNYLTTLNNFVHPYNSYNKLYISTNNLGKITITIDKLYNNEQINYVNENLKIIEEKIITSDMTTIDKIKAFHDYIINTTVYDEERADKIKNNIYSNNEYQSHKANGVLLNHIALCSGYTDIMAIFLNRLGIKNYKIANNDHIWNALYINDKWYHLDLTWDDPVISTGENIMIDDFFIIDDATLKNKDTIQHIYDENIYSEMTTSSN